MIRLLAVAVAATLCVGLAGCSASATRFQRAGDGDDGAAACQEAVEPLFTNAADISWVPDPEWDTVGDQAIVTIGVHAFDLDGSTVRSTVTCRVAPSANSAGWSVVDYNVTPRSVLVDPDTAVPPPATSRGTTE